MVSEIKNEFVEKQDIKNNYIESTTFLLAEDSLTTGNIYSDIIKEIGFKRIVRARDGKEAFDLYKEFLPDIMMLDWVMPIMDGITVCKRIREWCLAEENEGNFLRPYIIMSTAKTSIRDQQTGFASGVDDYLMKPVKKEELTARIFSAMRLVEFIKLLKDEKNKFARISRTDSLTELFNRRHTMERLEEEIARGIRNKKPLSIAMMDIDKFKYINDTWGHPGGDFALIHVAEHLKKNLRISDVVGRIGGDEFLAILPETEFEAAMKIMNRIISNISSVPHKKILPYELKSNESETGNNAKKPLFIPISISIGTSTLIPESREDIHRIYSIADQMLYESKSKGCGQCSGKNMD